MCVYAVMEGSITPTTNLAGLSFLIPPSARLLTRVRGRTLAGFKVNVYISSHPPRYKELKDTSNVQCPVFCILTNASSLHCDYFIC